VALLDLNADLVVLAACETARGGAGGGEGVVGLSWSFFLAGASSTLASQWKVASDSTAHFMIDFHRALRAPAADPALHKAQALRDAQLQSIRKKETAHPFHWAAFVLLGDPSVRVEP
jgi:CHAT domain-containing protein